MKLHRVDDDYVEYWCPGCGRPHMINLDPEISPRWFLTGTDDRPTLAPSVHVKAGRGETLCHSWVRDGMIEYLMDSSHLLAGKTVIIPEWL